MADEKLIFGDERVENKNQSGPRAAEEDDGR